MDGLPAKRSKTLPTIVFCWVESSTPAAVLMFVFSIWTLDEARQIIRDMLIVLG